MTPSGPTQKMQRRQKYVVMVVLLIAMAVVAGNLFNISVINHSDYEKKANSYQLRREMIPATRGTIYDSNMGVLAQSATAWDVTINPSEFKHDEERLLVAKGLAEILDMDETSILEKTQKKTQYVLIKRKVEDDVAEKVREFILQKDKEIALLNESRPADDQLKSTTVIINLQESVKRYYPNGSLASAVIGYTGTDSQGLFGLELKYDELLSGTPGYVVTLKNAFNENIPNNNEEGKFDPIDGNSLVLTIDETIQHFVEKTLQQVMVQNQPNKGCAGIVMDVRTGAVLAMASMPNYDLNNPSEINSQILLDLIAAAETDEDKEAARVSALETQRYNKAVSYAYEPGSTFKTLVASAALEEGTSTLSSSFYCSGEIVVGGETMHCHVHPNGHGQLDFTGAVVNSCNPSFVAIGKGLGASRFFQYFKNFGLTQKPALICRERASANTIMPTN